MGSDSERDDFEAGDKLEMSKVQRYHIEADMQGRCTDDQILKGDRDASQSLLTFKLTRQPGDGQGYRVHHHIPA